MTSKTFLSSSNKAKFICKACSGQFIVDMSEYLNAPSKVKLQIKCQCGYSWDTILLKRRYFRKKIDLPGTYKYKVYGKKDVLGDMTVLDISRRGLKIRVHDEEHQLKDGDWIEVAFRLDNEAKTLIKKSVNIKNVFGNYLGVVFSETNNEDAGIGFYMVQHVNEKKA